MSECILLKSGGTDLDFITATAADVVAPKVIINKDGEPVTGTMPNNGAIRATLNCGQSKAIPVGYTTGGTVTVNSLASQTSGTAAANNILSGKTAWVNGSKISGTIPSKELRLLLLVQVTKQLYLPELMPVELLPWQEILI